MRVAEINMIPYGSTGRIMLQIADCARKDGHTVKTFSTIPFDKRQSKIMINDYNHFVFGSRFENMIHYYLGCLLGRNGCFSYFGTLQLIKYLKDFNPDVIHLHNLHKFCINLPMLFRYIKKNDMRVVWTLHDCWAFTGQCPYFAMVDCNRWVKGCYDCQQLNVYPKAMIDRTKSMWRLKKKWFTGVRDLLIVTPSQWLSDLVKQSFLQNYPVKVIYNGIDLNIFKPKSSDFRKKYNCTDKYILLGVSLGWSKRKGIDVFIDLAESMGDKYQIVLVGTDDNIDKQLPANIISIHRTQNQEELAEIYTAADLFVNPTREEVFGLVNVEALACGTPVLTFNTGGSPEVPDNTCGSIVECNDIESLRTEIEHISINQPYTADACITRAKQFNMEKKTQEYVRLFK